MAREPIEGQNRGDERDETRFHDLLRREETVIANPGASAPSLYGVASGTHLPDRDTQTAGWTDKDIYDEVCMALEKATHIDTSLVDIEVREGTTYLNGKVLNTNAKRLVEDVVMNTIGVRGVMNNLDDCELEH